MDKTMRKAVAVLIAFGLLLASSPARAEERRFSPSTESFMAGGGFLMMSVVIYGRGIGYHKEALLHQNLAQELLAEKTTPDYLGRWDAHQRYSTTMAAKAARYDRLSLLLALPAALFMTRGFLQHITILPEEGGLSVQAAFRWL